jgi:cytochrome c biogenesis protein CcmG/thiol:disulfide interchange protein DsbE
MQKRLFIVGVVIIVGLLTFFGLSNHEKDGKLNVYSSLAGLKGFNQKDVEGQYFVLHFWAKWCEPCAEEIPTLVEFAKKAQFAKPFKVLAVSLDPTLEEAKDILPDHGNSLPPSFVLLLDPEHKVAEKMGSYQYPETYFIDPKGQIIEKWVGAQKWSKPQVFDFFKMKIL